MTKQNITIFLARPRGFCAGVTRAIKIVEEALALFGGKVYVRHEIVHNAHVVKDLENKGAIFVQELSEVPEGSPVIFSAHGVPLSVIEDAKNKGLQTIDATCPLVEKVHTEVKKLSKSGYKIILIGHAGHPEVIGTMGQVTGNSLFLLEKPEDLERLPLKEYSKSAYVTQTTLSIDETTDIIKKLKNKLPEIKSPEGKNICFATTNRQAAVKAIAKKCDMILVIGSPNSSNSKRLVEVARSEGCEKSLLVQDVNEVSWDKIPSDISSLGITAGASAPEYLVSELLEAFSKRYNVTLKEVKTCKENIRFKLPAILTPKETK
ncbi:MAG: 4-hydroxy-3-methylbut-2-enyl diphosphate reductase [Alphaproteobacteria bacterium]|nr:4-hydroxy-3-methylbut-2-enyl diphosphate reductase [Alphaproteobacteria bacterium]